MGLLSDQAITSEVMAAAEYIPFRFHPVQDSEFYTEDTYWRVPEPEKRAAGKKLVRRFERWYQKHAALMEKVYCAVAALTESDDALDSIIDDAKLQLTAAHRLKIIDASDAIYWVTDYHSVRDPFHIRNVLNNDRIDWWQSIFEKQAHRVEQIPRIPFQEFMKWNSQRALRERSIRDHFRYQQNPYNGYSMRESRRIVVRSIKLMEQFFNPKTTREFVNGKPIKIRGHYFEWVLRLNPFKLFEYSLTPPSHHIPFSLSLNDLNGVLLADACVVFHNTPVLDQAVAIGLNVASVEGELELLQKTNVFKLTQSGLDNVNLNTLDIPGLTLDRVIWDEEELERDRRRVFNAEAYRPPPRVPTIEEHREAMELEDIWEGGSSIIDPAFEDNGIGGSESPYTDIPTQINLSIFEKGTDFDLEANTLVDNLSAILRLPNRLIDGLSFRRSHVVTMFREVLLDQARTRILRERDPIASRLREELYRRLDVRPDILAYMAKPEFNFHYLDRLRRAPRLESFVTNGVFD